MEKFFNIAGPCLPNRHYMLPALDRMPQIRRLVARETYFVLHAPRQTGKTTAVEPVIFGGDSPVSRDSEDYRFVLDLGLMRENELRELVPSNRMYAEIIGRSMSWDCSVR